MRTDFISAQPFPHVVIDEFLSARLARGLLEQFPPAGQNAARNLYGAPGKKATHQNLGGLGPAYREVNEHFASAEFLDWLGDVTGIPDLLYDETNFGGGTHENFEGRDLRPHVDFNFHPVTRLHRRLNLILYLNDGWQPQWGGSIALYRDPRDPHSAKIEYVPAFNRCIIFEASERSWHGFDRIVLPETEKHRTRRSLSIYFYTRERPGHYIYREHTTFFVPRPLPPRYAAGYTLTESDELELAELMDQRDHLIELYQREQGQQEGDSAQAARLRIALANMTHYRVPMLGYVRQSGPPQGFYADAWAGEAVTFTVHAERAVRGFSLRLRLPSVAERGTNVCVGINGAVIAQKCCTRTAVEFFTSAAIARGQSVDMRIAVSRTVNPREANMSSDDRELGFLLERLVFEHDAQCG